MTAPGQRETTVVVTLPADVDVSAVRETWSLGAPAGGVQHLNKVFMARSLPRALSDAFASLRDRLGTSIVERIERVSAAWTDGGY